MINTNNMVSNSIKVANPTHYDQHGWIFLIFVVKIYLALKKVWTYPEHYQQHGVQPHQGGQPQPNMAWVHDKRHADQEYIWFVGFIFKTEAVGGWIFLMHFEFLSCKPHRLKAEFSILCFCVVSGLVGPHFFWLKFRSQKTRSKNQNFWSSHKLSLIGLSST